MVVKISSNKSSNHYSIHVAQINRWTHEYKYNKDHGEPHTYAVVGLAVAVITTDNKISTLKNIYKDSYYKRNLFMRDILQGHPKDVMIIPDERNVLQSFAKL